MSYVSFAERTSTDGRKKMMLYRSIFNTLQTVDGLYFAELKSETTQTDICSRRIHRASE
jgi:hypothetical protein